VSLERISFEQAGEMSLSGLLDIRAAETPDALAIRATDGQLTFAEWHQRTSAVAGFLQEHFGSLRGERVLLWMSSDDARNFVASLQAIYAHSAIVVALDDRFTAGEALRLIEGTDPRALLISRQVIENLGESGLRQLGAAGLAEDDDRDLIHIRGIHRGSISDQQLSWKHDSSATSPFTPVAEPGDDSIIFFSSGSTGAPKGAVWTHQGLVQYAERAAHAIYADPRGGRPMGPEDVLQSPVPLYTAASMMENLSTGLLSGCTLVFEDRRFSPQASERRMRDFGTTVYNGAPPHYAMMCDLPAVDPPPELGLMTSGGSAITPALYHRIRARWPGVAVANWFGLMESGVGQTLNFGADIEREPGAIGRPVWPTEYRIVQEGPPGEFEDVAPGDEGELWTRAPAQIREYYRNPEQTAKALFEGWLRTGDRAFVDAEGVIHVSGRNEERINRGGFKFYPIEIEQVLEEHELVREAAIIPVPHEVLGQDVVGYVVPASGAELLADELRSYCKTRLAPNKVPAEIIFKQSLPRGAYGKVVRRELVREYELANGRQSTGTATNPKRKGKTDE
jgi:acyl-CoA synthetase (AMP-forming)/AMP-acid ligase II